MNVKILVIDDEPDILELLTSSLEFAGFEVHGAKNSQAGLERGIKDSFDVIVCDVMLPDFDGFTLVTRLRDMHVNTPVLFLTAKDSVDNKIHGLAVGGDDYMVKPFSIEELIARVRAILRRTKQIVDNEEVDDFEKIVVQDLVIEAATHEVFRGDELIELSPTEYRLLEYLAKNAGRVVSKQQILEEVWGYDWSPDFSIVEAYISYLRKKVDSDPNRAKLIITKRSVGYMIR
jgi:two-component system OmpR family response regulator